MIRLGSIAMILIILDFMIDDHCISTRYTQTDGGKSTLDNCQVLQATVNRSKGNRTDISRADLIRRSSYCRVSGRDMDLLELSAYGNVRRGEDSGGCRIQ
ncbi:uncharacterized protein LOC141653183 isoform X2 [Silene latifolia]|uniref:uncharacterized protein LOC141653183 isoform X2 n=1 Tax=Silene latifolia TaxID=37657 RepID=UPI003D77E2D8